MMNVTVFGMRFQDGITLAAQKSGDALALNGLIYDLSAVSEGATLPWAALGGDWFAGDVSRTGGVLVLSLRYPVPANYSPEQAEPQVLTNLPDGYVMFPQPLPDEQGNYPELPPLITPTTPAVIDWSKLITAEMKAAALLVEQLATNQAKLNLLTKQANAQVAALQGRIDTINDAIDGGYALPEEEAELPGRITQLAAWKKYRVDLGRVKTQPTWPAAPVWPVVPELYAEGMSAVAAPLA